jgi:hypothetical protein
MFRFWSTRRGSTTVETALVFPIFIAVLVLTLEVVLMGLSQVTLVQALDRTARTIREQALASGNPSAFVSGLDDTAITQMFVDNQTWGGGYRLFCRLDDQYRPPAGQPPFLQTELVTVGTNQSAHLAVVVRTNCMWRPFVPVDVLLGGSGDGIYPSPPARTATLVHITEAP